jgi:hypothetical protein
MFSKFGKTNRVRRTTYTADLHKNWLFKLLYMRLSESLKEES